MQTLASQNGASLISLIVLLLVLGVVSAVMVSMMNTESYNAMNQDSSVRAMNIAAGGIERAIYQFKTGTACNSLVSGPMSLGSGSFDTIGTQQFNPNPLTTLNGNISNAATTIPVFNSGGYAPHGRIQIDSELIDYTAISGNQFIGARRGINGTTAVNHSTGATVLQAECLIRSTGTVANPLPGINNTRRIIETGVAYSTHQGSFTKSTAGAPVNQSIAGVGFQPKAVIFFWTNQTVQGFAPQNSNVNAGVGFAAGAVNRAVSITARDRRGSSDNGRYSSVLYSIVFLTGGGGNGQPTVVGRAQLTSFNPDGFTIRWTTNNASAYIIHYIAFGGDITNAFSGTFNLNTVAGNQSVNGVGFQPDFVLFLWSFIQAQDTQGIAGSEIGLGFGLNATARGALVYSGRDGSGSNVAKSWQQRTDSVILVLNPSPVGTSNTPPDQYAVANFVSRDVNGFTVDITTPPAANVPIFYLALKGGNHQVGAFLQPAAAGNQSVTGVGFHPEQLLLASFNHTAINNVTGGGAISYGAARYPTAMGNIWFQDRSDNDPSDANMYTSTGDVITMAYGTATGNIDGNPAVQAQADFTSFDRDGFTLNWTAADATARQILYWAIGPTVLNGTIDKEEIY